MEKLLKQNINDECRKLILRYNEYLYQLDEDIKRKQRRIDQPVAKIVKTPSYWELDGGFNPFIVRSEKHLATYAHTLAFKLKTLSYEPRTAVIYPIHKPSGGIRNLSVFQVPDAAISRFIYKSLLLKNVNRLSNYTYAYREDRNAHDAILNISSEWKNYDRVFVAEYDFSKFFDRIKHDYLWSVLKNHDFLYTELEEYVIQIFLTSRSSEANNYSPTLGNLRETGIPQGTSISLFLANIACWELDRELEGMGIRFARYADDTLLWSRNYESLVSAYDLLCQYSRYIGAPINYSKSEGISLLTSTGCAEIRTKTHVKYLGYDISLKTISITSTTVSKIQDKICHLIFQNLLQPLKQNIYNKNRLEFVDWDYITALSQVRRYLYGGLDDAKLLRYKMGLIPKLTFRGVMSYYPLVNDIEQMKKLDGWLIYTIKQALRCRQNLWRTHQGLDLPGPRQDWIEHIAELKQWRDPRSNKIYDLRIPSFLLISTALQKSLKQGGIQSVTNPRSIYYTAQTGMKFMSSFLTH